MNEDIIDNDYPADYQPLDILVKREIAGQIVQPITEEENE
jgi:hypothetical protein